MLRTSRPLATLSLPLLLSIGCGDAEAAPDAAEITGPLSMEAAGPADRTALVNATIPMTCVPPPPAAGEEHGIGPSPPCTVPTGTDPRFIAPDPSGEAHLIVRHDGGVRIRIDLRGLAPDQVITAWLAYYFPPGPIPDPIFEPVVDGRPVAGVAVPLARTDAAFTEGLGPEPNQFRVVGGTGATRGTLLVDLDYNPLIAGQGPLRNELSLVQQAAAPPGSGAEQPGCCPASTRPQPIGASFLRVFDQATGLPIRDPDGRAHLLRSPVPAVVIAIVAHIDQTTHGISAGLAIPPIPGIPATVGDHYTLGLFDLRKFHMEP